MPVDTRDADSSAQPPSPARSRVQSQPDAGLQRTYLVPILGVCAPVSVSGTRDQRIAAICRLQRGRIHRHQLCAAGVSVATIARMVARGGLYREGPAVYAVGHRTEVPLARETVALLVCGDASALSHSSADYVWEFVHTPPAVVELTAWARQTRSRAAITVHRSQTLLPRDITIRHGLPVTSVARTLLDQAEVVPARQLEWRVDHALLNRLVSLAQLNDVLRRANGRRGAGVLRAIVDREGPSTRTRSEPEERFLALVREAGLPAPEVNARLKGFEVDFLWRAQRVVLEIDSWGFHRTRNAFERDRRKGAMLSAAGFSVVRATDEQLAGEPVAVIVRVAQTLARAA